MTQPPTVLAMSKPSYSKREWKDEYTLLCEQCGYIVEGLDPTGRCPECGKSIVESLPGRRVGTPWQQKRSVKALVRTWWMTLRHPLKTLDILEFNSEGGDGQAMDSIALSAILSLFFSALLCLVLAQNPDLTIVFFVLSSLSAIMLVPVLFFLTHIEAVGLRSIGKGRGFRITKSISLAIINHACVGWLILGLSIGFGTMAHAVSFNLEVVSDNYALADQYRFVGNLVMLSGMLFGFLFFETFAYLGLRRCKYANRVRPSEHTDG